MKNQIIRFIKNETVLVISAVLAIVSMLFVPSSVIGYIDFRTLIILFGLMLVISGLRQLGFFTKMSQMLLEKVSGIRNISLILIGLCFFTSMFITNDVALITFVPFAIELLGGLKNKNTLIKVIVLQTIAANLGSSFMPMGSPHNIYLYSVSEMGILDFIRVIFPYSLLAMLLLFAVVMLMKNDKAESVIEKDNKPLPKNKIILYALLFVICILSVLRIVPEFFMLALVSVIVLIFDRKAFNGVDYSLLLTFVCFFIFVGSIGSITSLREWLSGIITGNEVAVSIILSQAISNVPASILLLGFTDNYSALIVGINLGGLGTIIASMASLISYKFYASFDNSTNEKHSTKGKYLLTFTMWNLIFLMALVILYIFIVKFK